MINIFLLKSIFVRVMIPENSRNIQTLHFFIRIYQFDNWRNESDGLTVNVFSFENVSAIFWSRTYLFLSLRYFRTFFWYIYIYKLHSSKNPSQKQVWQNMINNLLKGTFSITCVNLQDKFHGIKTVPVEYSKLLYCLFHGKWALTFRFWKRGTHVYNSFALTEDWLKIHIYLPRP